MLLKNVVADREEKVARELLACGSYKYLKTSDKLPQTGQLWWPVLVLLFAGAICLLVGRILRDRKEEKNR